MPKRSMSSILMLTFTFFLSVAIPQSFAQLELEVRDNQPLNRSLCLSNIRTALNQSVISPSNTSVFHPPFPANYSSSEIFITVPACQIYCGSKHEKKDDCAGRIKEWMLPVLLLLVSVEPSTAAALTAGVWQALGFYMFVMGDPAGMLRGLIGRMISERRFRIVGGVMWEEVKRRRMDRVHVYVLEGAGVQDVAADRAGEMDIGLHHLVGHEAGGQEMMLLNSMNGESSKVRVITDLVTEVRGDMTRQDEAKVQNLPDRTKDKKMSKSSGIILSAVADLLSDSEAAKGALRHALIRTPPEMVSYDAQDEAVLRASASLRFVHTRGVVMACIAVGVCILELIFLIIGPLQQQISASPSGAKIASAATFAWLLPLVVLSAYLGAPSDPKMAREVIKGLFEILERGERPQSDGSEHGGD
ncbi:hypothetical protein QBC43DRAFT_329443 [Cladorrhinum sp. PSN259]|nr:hypothetical protein QBC43DRAFT_329443 [Cladorrhinum sp. PSN259]